MQQSSVSKAVASAITEVSLPEKYIPSEIALKFIHLSVLLVMKILVLQKYIIKWQINFSVILKKIRMF